MLRTASIRATACVFIFSLPFTSSWGREPADGPFKNTRQNDSASGVLEDAMHAQRVTLQRFSRVHATGKYKFYGGSKDNSVLLVEADFEFFKNAGNYSIDLRMTLDDRPTSYSRIVTIRDGDDISLVSFSPSINPTGCRVSTYSTENTALQSSGLDLRNIRWNSQRMVRIKDLIKNVGRDAITAKPLEDGVIRFSYDLKGSQSWGEFDVSTRDGFSVVNRRTYRNRGDSDPVQLFDAKWRPSNGAWRIESLEEAKVVSGSPRPFQRTVVAFTKFDDNPQFAPDQFQLSKIGIPEGTRTINRR